MFPQNSWVSYLVYQVESKAPSDFRISTSGAPGTVSSAHGANAEALIVSRFRGFEGQLLILDKNNLQNRKKYSVKTFIPTQLFFDLS